MPQSSPIWWSMLFISILLLMMIMSSIISMTKKPHLMWKNPLTQKTPKWSW